MSYEVEKIWITEVGLKAVSVFINTGNYRCGYVEVPKGHPLYGVDYKDSTDVLNFNPNETVLGKRSPLIVFTAIAEMQNGQLKKSPELAFDVHGGITYSGGGDGYPIEGDSWWFGFDCAHDGDYYLFSSGSLRTLE